MASTDARPIPLKNTAYRVVFPILDADGDLVTGATGLDSEVSIDQGTFADCTNEATEIATSSGMYYLDLTAGEMNGDCIALIVKTTSSGAKTTVLVFYPQEADDLKVSVTHWLGTAAATPTVAGVPEVDVTHFAGTAATAASGRPEVNTTHIAGAAVSTTTAQIGANVVQVSGDSAAADNLEAAADGTGYNLGGGAVVAASVTGAVGSVTGAVGSVTATVNANVTQLSGDTTAADNAEAFFDGTGYTGGGALRSGIVSEGVLDAGGAASFTLPTGQRANVAIGDAIYIPAKGSRIIATYNSSTGAGTAASNFDSAAAASDSYVVQKLPKAEPLAATDFADGFLTAAKIATDAIDADALAADAVAEIQSGLALSTQVDALEAAATAIEADTQDIQARLPAALTAGGNIKADALAVSGDTGAADNLEAALDGTGGVTITAALTGNVTGNLSGSVGSVTGNVGGNLGGTLTSTERNAIADALLERNVAGGSSTGRKVKEALAFLRNKWSISGGTLTVYDTDDTTALFTATITTASGNPVSTVDPA